MKLTIWLHRTGFHKSFSTPAALLLSGNQTQLQRKDGFIMKVKSDSNFRVIKIKNKKIDDLLKKIKKNNKHGVIDLGPPVGKEII